MSACAARHLALHDDEVAAALRGIDAERYTLTQRLLNKYRRDPEDALQHVALAVLQQERHRHATACCAPERIAALAPPVAGVVMLAEWLAYVDWEGFDSALYANIEAVAAFIAGALGPARGGRQPAANARRSRVRSAAPCAGDSSLAVHRAPHYAVSLTAGTLQPAGARLTMAASTVAPF